mmetsp:Transcript_1658/g.3998  ORF Transcript_1658/g.3998 Transcript_1658/m.3998 type:complete len:208 (-) Transcript_1658:181-804(-)
MVTSSVKMKRKGNSERADTGPRKFNVCDLQTPVLLPENSTCKSHRSPPASPGCCSQPMRTSPRTGCSRNQASALATPLPPPPLLLLLLLLPPRLLPGGLEDASSLPNHGIDNHERLATPRQRWHRPRHGPRLPVGLSLSAAAAAPAPALAPRTRTATGRPDAKDDEEVPEATDALLQPLQPCNPVAMSDATAAVMRPPPRNNKPHGR